tara:strand:+ start:133 stop:423 length:291 start_codon:yes stop_codon:yes gene_type:complete
MNYQKGTVLKINFKHNKDARNKKMTKKIYLGDYTKLFNFINKDSIFVEAYQDADLKVYDSYMILTLTNELDPEHEEYIQNKLKNTKIVGIADVEIW